MKTIRLHIHSLEKTLFDGEAEVVSLPTETGVISILPGHTPLVATLKEGTIESRTGTDTKKIPITGGFAQINHNAVIILLN